MDQEQLCTKAQNLTPMMAQYQSVKSNYKDEILFFRLGDFYEMFNQDAVEVSRLLNLTLTHRQDQPMCGVPYHAAKVYIARLLRLGKKVVICEQVGEVPKGKGITERKVTQIITPGTAVDQEYLDGNNANYLAALSIYKGKVGFAFIDVSTSSFRATSWNATNIQDNFLKELNRASPRELLLPLSLKNNKDISFALSSKTGISVSYYPDWDFSYNLSFSKLTNLFNTVSLKSFGLNEDSAEIIPAGFLIDYLEKTTNAKLSHIKSIQVYYDTEYLILDDSSRKNLEVVENMRDGKSEYTLLDCLNFTKTAMGCRKLRNYLLFPLTNVQKIQERQNKVSFFYNEQDLTEKLRVDLSTILDIERLTSRIAMEKAHPKDLQALKTSLVSWLRIKKYINSSEFAFTSLEESVKIIELIETSILEDPSTSLTEGRIIKEGWSEQLDKYKKINQNFNQILTEYEAEEKQKTGINNLKIKYNNAAGYFIEVTKGKLSSVPPHFIMRRALVNQDRYTTEHLQELEMQLNESSTKIIELERDLFIEIRNQLQKYIQYLLQLSSEISSCDVLSTLALVAFQNNWSKPEIDTSNDFIVENGRHPVVEKHLPSGEFVPNDLIINDENKDSPHFKLITGPNMAGKSTYLRQNALIALLAQTGSFVPATKAKIGVIDRIFCRVGASDNLAKGESTFLVEMIETANILRSASSSSLVIMDEVGRGTSTEDGLAIARAVSEYLLDKIQCKTLFATHYHELSRMEHEALEKLCLLVSEENGSVVFLRKVIKGITENSYGIHVASLAGVPEPVILRATKILEHIQNIQQDKPVISIEKEELNEVKDSLPPKNNQNSNLFSDEEIILSEMLSVDTDNVTPIQALQMITRWKKTLNNE